MSTDGDEENKVNKIYRTSILKRSLLDYELMLDSETHRGFFLNKDTLKSLFSEQKELIKKLNITYLVTAVGASIVFLGPFPADVKVSAGSFEAPVNIIPQQIFSLVTSIFFGQLLVYMASFIILNTMITKILQKEGVEAWHFFYGGFDATHLWTTLVAPRNVGYKSPKRHWALVVLVLLTTFISILTCSAVVLISAFLSFKSALNSDIFYLKFFGFVGLFVDIVSIFCFLFMIIIPIPFRLSKNSEKS
ncbi:hypothetical protein [Radicibacter daui]|uniref:hypothetical protein n=1 Tax=Radicibacter daui TaxID=3064829 RepID=UPI0040470506